MANLGGMFKGLVEGFAGAAGADDVVSRMEDEKQRNQGWQDLARQHRIQQVQDASLNVGKMLRSGKHPDTGAPLTPDEVTQLTQQNNNLQAYLADLWNPHIGLDQMGKHLQAITGATQPESGMHKLTDKLHVTKPPAPSTGPAPGDVMKGVRQSVSQYEGEPEGNKFLQTYNQLRAAGQSVEDAMKGARIAFGIEAKPTSKFTKIGNPVKNSQGKWVQPVMTEAGSDEIDMPEDYAGPTEKWTAKGNPVQVDGKWMQPEINPQGETRLTAMPEGYKPAGKPITATQAMLLSYAATRGKKGPEDFDAEDWKAYTPWAEKNKTRFSETQEFIADADGNVHVVPKTTVSRVGSPAGPGAAPGNPAPGSGVEIEQPLASPRNLPQGNVNIGGIPATVSGNVPSSSVTPAAPKDRTLPFQKGTPAYTKAKEDWVGAVKMKHMADALPGSGSEGHYKFVLSLIKSSAGRVNAQEINAVFGAGGVQSWLDRVKAKTIKGELTPTQIKQLQDVVDEEVKASKAAMLAAQGKDDTSGDEELPPEAVSKLRRGYNTKFKGKGTWTLDENGKPKKVADAGQTQ